MPIKTNFERQYVLSAFVDFTYADLAAGANVAIEVPGGAVVVGGDLAIDTVFDSTTNTLAVGDGGSATRYLGATNVKATGRTAITPTGYVYPATDTIDLTYALTGSASTTGAGRLRIDYIIRGRGNENQGD